MGRRGLAAGLAALLVLALGGCADSAAPAGTGFKVGVAYDVGAAGDPVNVLTQQGLARARTQLGGKIAAVREFYARADETDEDRYDRLIILCQSGYDPVLAVGYLYAGPDPAAGPLARAAQACPGTRFALVDDASVTAPNVTDLAFADADGSYLMGVAAGLSTRTGAVGFVGGCQVPAVAAYATGFQAGVLAARPGTQVRTSWLATDPARCDRGFTDSDQAGDVATQFYAGGVDVVYAVAGAAGSGVYVAAKRAGTLALGYGTDTWATIGATLQSTVLTSMIKKVDWAVSGFVTDAQAGRFTAGVRRGDLANQQVGYAGSGPAVAPLVPRLDEDTKKIVNGTIIVPSGV